MICGSYGIDLLFGITPIIRETQVNVYRNAGKFVIVALSFVKAEVAPERSNCKEKPPDDYNQAVYIMVTRRGLEPLLPP